MRGVLGILVMMALGAAFAAPPQQDINALRKAVESFVLQQTAGMPGKVSVTVGSIEPLPLPPCAKFDFFLPANSRLWGNENVGVRCAQAANWTLFVPVSVRVQGSSVVAARQLPIGRQLVADDLAVQSAELTQLPAGTVTDIKQAVGKVLTIGVAAGSPLRADMLRAPLLVRQGQKVKLVAQGPGFRVSSEGKALGNGSAGDIVQVKAQNGQVISGTVNADGTVGVDF